MLYNNIQPSDNVVEILEVMYGMDSIVIDDSIFQFGMSDRSKLFVNG